MCGLIGYCLFLQAEDGIRDAQESRGLGDVYKRQPLARPLSLRIECCGKIIAYTGDTEWNDVIPEISRGADLLVCEAFEYQAEAGNHINYLTLLEHRRELECGRIILTHLGDTMLGRCGSLEFECAQDGSVIEI